MDSYYHKCLHCHDEIIVKEDQLGIKINCTNCDNFLKVPSFFKKDKLVTADTNTPNMDSDNASKKESNTTTEVFLEVHKKINCSNCDESIFDNQIICPSCNWNHNKKEFAFTETNVGEAEDDNSAVIFHTGTGNIPLFIGVIFAVLGVWFYMTFRDLERHGGELVTYQFIITLYQSVGLGFTTFITFSIAFVFIFYSLFKKF